MPSPTSFQDSRFFDLAQGLLSVCKTDGTIVRANKSWKRIMGLESEALVGRSIMEFAQSPGWTDFRAEMPSTAGFVGPQGVFVCALARDLDEENSLVYVSAMPELLLDHEATGRWQRALEGSSAGYWDMDLVNQRYFNSEQYYRMLGYEPNEFEPGFDSWLTMLHPDDVERSTEYYRTYFASLESNCRLEFRMRAKNGEYRWILAVGMGVRDDEGNLRHASGWNFDITEQVVAREQLEASEERSRRLIEAIPDLIVVLDREGKFLEAHSTSAALAKNFPSDLVGKSVFEVAAKETADELLAAINTAIDENRVVTFHPIHRNHEGRTIHFETRVAPGAGRTALVISRDVTEIRAAESSRREVEERLRALSQNVPGLIFQFQTWRDRSSSFPYANHKALEVLGVSPADLRARGYDGVNPPFAHPDDKAGLFQAFRTAALAKSSVDWEGRIFVASGECKWLRLLATPEKQRDGSVIWSGFALDVTVENQLRQTLQEQQALMSASSRLAALGEMAGGIAHEINNPLTVAHAYASRLRDLAHEGRIDERAVDVSAEKIENVCMRISRIIAGLRTLARDGAEDFFVPSKASTLVNDALSLCSEKLKHMQIELMVEPIPDTISIECRPVQISQVLVNLLSNAQHAVEAKPNTRWIRIECVDRGDDVELRVSDSGEGVAAHLQTRIFDPFFTTKEVGKGTGLGLSVSASIARSHGGKLMLESVSPHTTFVLRLPKKQPDI